MRKKTSTLFALIINTITINYAIAQSTETDVVISTKKGLNVKLIDNNTSFQLGGVLQWDYEQDKFKTYDNIVGFDIRRARFYIKGHIEDWAYKATYKLGETSNTNGDAVELYIRYTGLDKLFNITVGKQKEPFGLELLTSSIDISLLERSAITEYYTTAPNLGIKIHGRGNNWTYGLGLFESNNKNNVNISNSAITGRITKAMKLNNQLFVHLGAGFTLRNNYINKKDIANYNVEFASVYSSFHIQAEYFHTSTPSPTYTDQGYYIQVGYTFNGTRPYKNGIFKGVLPQNEFGAWEFVARYEDGLGKFSDVNLGNKEGKQISSGVNYYFNKHTRIGTSYMLGKAKFEAHNNKEFRARLQFLF